MAAGKSAGEIGFPSRVLECQLGVPKGLKSQPYIRHLRTALNRLLAPKDHGLVRRTDGLGKPIQFGTSGGGGSGTDFRSIASDVARPR
jgi:hypothetical protein